MTTATSERDLVINLHEARKLLEDLEEKIKLAEERKSKAEFALIELLESTGADKTARYPGVGSVTLLKPACHASCNQENREKLFEYLKEKMREDLIKSSVHPSSLSAFVNELLNEGKQPPDFISYYLRRRVQFNKPRK